MFRILFSPPARMVARNIARALRLNEDLTEESGDLLSFLELRPHLVEVELDGLRRGLGGAWDGKSLRQLDGPHGDGLLGRGLLRAHELVHVGVERLRIQAEKRVDLG